MFVIYINKKKNYGAIIAIVIATISSIISLGLYLYRFGFDFSAQISDWINTATYFNNLLSPIFLFITILLLYWTWRDTKEALEIQSKELSLQRRELRRNRSIQERQLKTQKLKDDLDIFARRVNDLNIKFHEENRKILKASENTISNLVHITSKAFDDEALRVMYDHLDKETQKKFDYQFIELKDYVSDYYFVSTPSLYEIFSTYPFEHAISDDEFIQFSKIHLKFPVHCLNTALAYALIKDDKKPIELVAFYKLMMQIYSRDVSERSLFIDEFQLGFDLNLAKKLLKLNNDLPDNLIDY